VCHHDATAARVPLSRGSHSFQEAESQPLPQLPAATGSMPPAGIGLPRPGERVILALPAMNKRRHMRPKQHRPQTQLSKKKEATDSQSVHAVQMAAQDPR